MYRYCESWPPELKQAEQRRYRAECKVRCLTAALDRTAPECFDALMLQIEQAQQELLQASMKALDLIYQHNVKEYENKKET